MDALVELMVRLGRFAADHAETIAEIDLNPVLVHERGQGRVGGGCADRETITIPSPRSHGVRVRGGNGSMKRRESEGRAVGKETPMRLADRIAIIVGAGQGPGEGMGNGRATALVFAREGAKVLAVDIDLKSAQGDGGDGLEGGRPVRRLRRPT